MRAAKAGRKVIALWVRLDRKCRPPVKEGGTKRMMSPEREVKEVS